jgi:hypothetical protein
VKCYEKMALCYFYLGDLHKCQYYFVKGEKGMIEPSNSGVR